MNTQNLDEEVVRLISDKNLNHLVGMVVYTLAAEPTSIKNLKFCQEMLDREIERIHRAITNY